MPNPFAAVARTYPQRLFSSWLPASFLIGLALVTIAPFLNRHASRSGNFDFDQLFPAAYVIGTIALHLKQLTIDAKGRLLPRSMWPVLIVTGACAVLYLTGLPLLMSACGRPLLWSAALVWIWCAAVSHFVIRPSWAIGIALALAYVWLMHASSSGTAWLATADHSSIPWLFLLASVVWFAIITRWLLHMNEQSRGYKAIQSGQTAWLAREGSTEQTNRPWQDPSRSWWLRFNSPGQRQMDRLVRFSDSPSIFVRCRRWQVSGMQQYLPCFMALATSIPMVAVFRTNGGTGPSPLLGTLQMPAMFAVILPAMQYWQQWRTRANDLLKPIRREDYLREMGLCLAIDLVRNVAMVALIVFGICALAVPNRVPPADLSLWTLALALSSIFAFGSSVWLLRYRSPIPLMAPGLVIVFLFILLGAPRGGPSLWSLGMGIAAILALAGVWLTRNAYRRWLLTDLG